MAPSVTAIMGLLEGLELEDEPAGDDAAARIKSIQAEIARLEKRQEHRLSIRQQIGILDDQVKDAREELGGLQRKLAAAEGQGRATKGKLRADPARGLPGGAGSEAADHVQGSVELLRKRKANLLRVSAMLQDPMAPIKMEEELKALAAELCKAEKAQLNLQRRNAQRSKQIEAERAQREAERVGGTSQQVESSRPTRHAHTSLRYINRRDSFTICMSRYRRAP